MTERARLSLLFLSLALAGALVTGPAPAQTPAAPSKPALRDGSRDFDYLLGTWKYHLKRLVNPLTGSKEWIEFDGTGTCRPLFGGLAQIDELDVNGPTGKVQGLTLRLYNPESRQWSLNWANLKTGKLGVPTVGAFDAKNGRGEFYDQEEFNGRMILVRYVWSGITPNSAHFEQSFSDDGGKTWEVNWITDQVRVVE